MRSKVLFVCLLASLLVPAPSGAAGETYSPPYPESWAANDCGLRPQGECLPSPATYADRFTGALSAVAAGGGGGAYAAAWIRVTHAPDPAVSQVRYEATLTVRTAAWFPPSGFITGGYAGAEAEIWACDATGCAWSDIGSAPAGEPITGVVSLTDPVGPVSVMVGVRALASAGPTAATLIAQLSSITATESA